MKQLWESEQNKAKRMKGEEYFGRRNNDSNKNVFDVRRPKRKLKQRCQCEAKPNSQFKCYKFSEEIREKLFKHFWQLDWKERKILVKQLVDRRFVSNRRVNSVEFRRKGSLYYHLNLDDNEERVRVCKKMFLSTLSVGGWSVTNWVSNPSARQENENSEEKGDSGLDGDVNNDVEQNVQSVKNNKTAKEDSIRKKIIKEYFAMLPKLESHYCRKNTQKLYLEPNWQSKAQLYRHYRSYCESEGKKQFIASDCLFYSLFDELNLGLFSPKKDQCDLCCSFNKGNLTQELYEEHIKKKDEARSEKDADKGNTDERTAVYSMDMQAVLLSPSLKASTLYYKMKLKVHNYTFYDLKTNDAFCYIWNENEGGLDADEFASIITHFLVNEVDRSKYDHVILYSDGCTYQNRNCVLSNALLFTSSVTGLIITQKFLEKGHTQMECDSMHSVIERKLRNREIYSPAGYVEVCKTARLNPRPYKVNYLDHTFFRKYNTLQFVSSIRPGKKRGILL
ncbi:hypothetical protein J6590_108696 [Homalodisca vitripennis]|nr:hypothetical protein J6590_108696 [Homalodisca vitripennis]